MENDKLLQHSRKILLIGICLSSILTIIFLFDFNHRTDYHVELITQNYLMESANQGSIAIQQQINARLANLRYTANFLIRELDLETRMAVMNKNVENEKYIQLKLLDRSGQEIVTAGQESSLADLSFYSSELMGKAGLSEAYYMSSLDQYVASFYVPAISRGEVMGELIATLPVSDVIDANMNVTLQGNAYYYVISDDGCVIEQSQRLTDFFDVASNTPNYYELLNSIDDISIDVDKLHTAILERESGSFDMTLKGNRYFIYYKPLEVNDWYLFTLISSDNVAIQNEQISTSAYYLTVKLVITFACLFTAYYYLANRAYKGIIQGKKALERSNKMFELALQHSFATMFEYDIEKDHAHFLKEKNIKALCDYEDLCPFSQLVFENHCLNEGEKDVFIDAMNEVKQGKDKVVFEIKSGARFDEVHWFRFTLVQLPSEARGKNILGIVEDISEEVTKRHLLKQEIRMKEALFHEALSVWTLNLDSQIIYSYTREGLVQDTHHELEFDDICEAMLSIVHQDDLEMVKKLVNYETLKQEFMEGKEIRIEYRIKRTKDKEYIWVESVLNYYALDNKAPMLLCYTMDIDEDKNHRIELKKKSERDPLTGLYNRTAFKQLIDNELEHLSTNQAAAFFMMDLDEFKLVNDTLGHAAGDDLLMQVAYRLRDIRDYCEACEMLIARFGGDEFVAYVKGENRADIVNVGHCILRDIQGIKLYEQQDLQISISVGIAFVDELHHSFDLLYESADQALYDCKYSGKNRISIHN